MKKRFILLIVMLLMTAASSWAQESTDWIPFQGILRNANNDLLIDQGIGVQVEILEGGETGEVVFTEEHNVVTNRNGLMTFKIGRGISNELFDSIQWEHGVRYYARISVDITGGINYSEMGTYELKSRRILPNTMEELINSPDSTAFLALGIHFNFLRGSDVDSLLNEFGVERDSITNAMQARIDSIQLVNDSIFNSHAQLIADLDTANMDQDTNIVDLQNSVISINNTDSLLRVEIDSTNLVNDSIFNSHAQLIADLDTANMDQDTSIANLQYDVGLINNTDSLQQVEIDSLILRVSYLEVEDSINKVRIDTLIAENSRQELRLFAIENAINNLLSSQATQDASIVSIANEVDVLRLNLEPRIDAIELVSNGIVREVDSLSMNHGYRISMLEYRMDTMGGGSPAIIVNTDVEIGDTILGGQVFYIDTTGRRALICPFADASTNAIWSVRGSAALNIPQTNGILGSNAITNLIYSNDPTTAEAARLCINYTTVDEFGTPVTDWRLPTMDEAGLMYTNLHLSGLGNFNPNRYWTCTIEAGIPNDVRTWDFITGIPRDNWCDQAFSVRPVKEIYIFK